MKNVKFFNVTFLLASYVQVWYIQDKITVYWLLINPLKMWHSSSIWEQQ